MEMLLVVLFVGCLVCYVAVGGVHLGSGLVGVFGNSTARELAASTRRAGWELSQFSLLGLCGLMYFSFPRLFVIFAGPLIVPFLALLICALCSGVALILSRYRITSLVLFRVAAFGVPFCLGLLGGALILGRLDFYSQGTYHYFFRPWLNVFCFNLGLFMISLFWFLGANYFSSSSESLKKTAVGLSGVALSFGALVFVMGELHGLPLFSRLFSRPLAFLPFTIVGALWIAFSVWVHRLENRWQIRWIGFASVGALVSAWLGLYFPVLARFEGGEVLVLERAIVEGWVGPLLGGLGLSLAFFAPRDPVKIS